MDRRTFFRRAPIAAVAIAVTPSILEQLVKPRSWISDTLKRIDLERRSFRVALAIAWLRDNGWRVEKLPDRQLYIARKTWQRGGTAYQGAFSFSPLINGNWPPPSHILRQVQYQAGKKEQYVERIRTYRRVFGVWPHGDEEHIERLLRFGKV